MAKTQQTFEKRLERVKEITALLEGGDCGLSVDDIGKDKWRDVQL